MGDLAEIVRAVGDEYVRTRATTPFQRKALWAITRCRTPALGSVVAMCGNCGAEHTLYRSCRNRHCPRCQVQAREAWLDAREREILPVPYFHVVFTIPETLNPIAQYCPEVFYAALLRAAGNALLDVGRSKLHARLGCLAVLHTWGQNLSLHPHVHCVVPGGGFSEDGRRWVASRNPAYLLPIRVLSRRFRTLLCQALRAAAANGELHRVPPEVAVRHVIERAARQEWIAYAKPPFGGPEQVLAYLSQYTHRIAISNRRIVSFAGGRVTFRWRDYADSNRTKYMTLGALEFLRRYLMHVLPDRFVRIRYFGFMANGQRKRAVALARTLIRGEMVLRPRTRTRAGVLCPACHAAAVAKRAHALQHERPDRAPPLPGRAA